MKLVFKAHHAAILVEGELIEGNMRRVISSLSYWATRFCFERNEHSSLNNLFKSEFHLVTRKWRRFGIYEVRRPELTEEQRILKTEQEQRIAQGEEIPEDQLIVEPEPYEERVDQAMELEKDGMALEEFLLSLIDFQDLSRAKAERWKVNLTIDGQALGEEGLEKVKQAMLQPVDFWVGVA
jgi:hypothetical protein